MRRDQGMRKIFKEPLLVFFLLGGAIFVLFQQVSDMGRPDNADIVVSEKRIELLTKGFEKIWQRPPLAEELDGLIENYIRQEVFYREALAMGLDKNDDVVRRRLRQKMQFISEDISALAEPTEQELAEYLAAHQQDYRQPRRYSFHQIYFDPSRRGKTAEQDAEALLKKLQTTDIDIAELGDSLMLESRFTNTSERRIEHVFGFRFAKSLAAMDIGSWQGPVRSGLGLHLVRIDDLVDGKDAELNDVRALVLRDFTALRRKQTNDDLYELLRKRYRVTVEKAVHADQAERNTIMLSMDTTSS